jgi:hypothetical protein
MSRCLVRLGNFVHTVPVLLTLLLILFTFVSTVRCRRRLRPQVFIAHSNEEN